MRYTVLNNLYWITNGLSQRLHYRKAMNSRGWLPDLDHWMKYKRALEGRGPRNEDQPVASSSPWRERAEDKKSNDAWLRENAIGRPGDLSRGWDDD